MPVGFAAARLRLASTCGVIRRWDAGWYRYSRMKFVVRRQAVSADSTGIRLLKVSKSNEANHPESLQGQTVPVGPRWNALKRQAGRVVRRRPPAEVFQRA